MAKKRKIRADRILIIVLLVILIALIVVLGVKVLFKNANNDETKQEVVVQETIESEGLKIENLGYEVYKKNEELGFGFVVANLRFKNKEAINYDLVNLKTDEGITLNDTFIYEKKLKTSGFDFNSLNTTIDIVSTSGQLEAKIFIPFVKERNNLMLTDMLSSASLTFDLNKNVIDMSNLKSENEKEEIISSDYEFSCNKPYIEEMMKHNGEPYNSSMLSVYTFRLTCISVKDGVKVTGASFINKEGEKVADAYDSSYSSSKVDNILDKSLKAGDVYALFFELYSNQDDRVAYEGTIKLNFSDGSTAEVKAVLD